jgi:UDP-N-acetylenolpyruvoylglucosamine reductase
MTDWVTGVGLHFAWGIPACAGMTDWGNTGMTRWDEARMTSRLKIQYLFD